MTDGAQTIIEEIFDVAAEDERTRPVLAHLRRAYDEDDWTPEALAGLIEHVSSQEMKQQNS